MEPLFATRGHTPGRFLTKHTTNKGFGSAICLDPEYMRHACSTHPKDLSGDDWEKEKP